MNWNKINKNKPCHKDLVLAKMNNGTIVPSIYYDNESFVGFYPYTTYYLNHMKDNYYSEVVTDTKFEDVCEWTDLLYRVNDEPVKDLPDDVKLSQSDIDHLSWIYGRLCEVHGENENYDYMLRLKKIIDYSKKYWSEIGFHYRFMVIANDYLK